MGSSVLSFQVLPEVQARYEKLRSQGITIDVSYEGILRLGLRDLLGDSSEIWQSIGGSELLDKLMRKRQSKEETHKLFQQVSDNLAESLKFKSDYAIDSEKLVHGLDFFESSIAEMEKMLSNKSESKA